MFHLSRTPFLPQLFVALLATVVVVNALKYTRIPFVVTPTDYGIKQIYWVKCRDFLTGTIKYRCCCISEWNE